MSGLNINFDTLGYLLTAAGYLLLTLMLLAAYRKRLQAAWLSIATAVTVLWAVAFGVGIPWIDAEPYPIFVAEFVFDAAWLLYLASLLSGAAGGLQIRLLRFGGVSLAIGALVAGSVLEYLYRGGQLDAGSNQILVLGQILTALAVLINVEQIYRNARKQQRRDLKYLCLGVGVIFAFDLLMYSNAILVGQISDLLWLGRGYVVAMCLPLIGFAVKRSPEWKGGIFVSRQIVFHTSTMFGAGIYLTLVGVVGQFLLEFGGGWGSVAQIVFLSGAVIGLLLLLVSERIRGSLRVFISKHFYQNKYDYRHVWLRLINTLTTSDQALPLRKRAIMALAEIVGAPTGLLWMRFGESSDYRMAANWNTETVYRDFAATDELPVFLADRGWIIDWSEFQQNPSLYAPLRLTADTLGLKNLNLIVPLIDQSGLFGFVALSEPANPAPLNYEDRDLLKTAGKQVASYLSQDAATEMLAQSRQFEAYNKLTAYIMHDLKNIVAQQSLVVANAQKHRDNPAFIDDAIEASRSGVARMRRVIDQLRQGSLQHSLENIEVGALIMKAVSDCATRRPEPRAQVGDSRVWVRADRERLQMAIYHAIRNAQDATPADGEVEVLLSATDGECEITVRDTGDGMDETFIRERLFRPFDSTKGTSGMGIGAYQIRETLTYIGGTLHVESEKGRGTTLQMRLPTAKKV
jgi:putative PEP-CTERM system histidine kinase